MTTAQSRLMPLGSLLALLIVAALVVQLLLPSRQAPVIKAAGAGYWSTSGTTIIDANNQPVRLTGVNWFGAETDSYVPHGLWNRSYKSMMDQMKTLGYNSIRLPFSNEMLTISSTSLASVNYYQNPELVGLKPIEIMDRIIDYAGEIGLRIILDRHRITAGGQSPLWYLPDNPAYNDDRFISDWKILAERYKAGSPVVTSLGIIPETVIGADLHNEPHSDSTNNNDSCWGCGTPVGQSGATNPPIGSPHPYDWRLAAERAGNAILSVNPGWLIFVQGVGCWGKDASGKVIADVPTAPAWPSLHCTWWGGNLRGVPEYPVRLEKPNKLVYSVHEYPATVHEHKWFDSSTFADKLDCVWEHYWAYIVTRQYCDGGPDGGDEAFLGTESRKPVESSVQKVPIWVGEYGSVLGPVDRKPLEVALKDKPWFDAFVPYLKEKGLSWSYWSWNPNSGDTGGVLNNDWTSLAPAPFYCTGTPCTVTKHSKIAGENGVNLVTLDPAGNTPNGSPTTSASNGWAIPGTIQAESYSTMSGVQREATTDTGGGENVGYIDANDWMDYSVNVQSAGSYSVQLRVASALSGSNHIQIRNGSGATLATVTVPNTGGWQTWQTVNATVNLSAGNQTLRIYAGASAWNINWMSFSNGSNPTVAATVTRTNTTVPTATATATRTNTTGPTATATRTNTTGPSATATRTNTTAPTATATTQSGGGGTCSPATTQSAPFTYDGSGTFCWQIATIPSHINSSNLISLSINGTSYTNQYVAAGSLPPKINGYWYISYSSNVNWGHFEAR